MGSCTDQHKKDWLRDLLERLSYRSDTDSRDAVDAIKSLRAERDSAQTAYDCVQEDCRNLTTKVIPNLRAERDEAVSKERSRIKAALNAMLHCPCCDTTDVCDDECTFAADCPHEAQSMQYLRDVLTGA